MWLVTAVPLMLRYSLSCEGDSLYLDDAISNLPTVAVSNLVVAVSKLCSLNAAPVHSVLYMSTWLHTVMDIWTNTLRAVITTKLNYSHRSRVGVEMNGSPRLKCSKQLYGLDTLLFKNVLFTLFILIFFQLCKVAINYIWYNVSVCISLARHNPLFPFFSLSRSLPLSLYLAPALSLPLSLHPNLAGRIQLLLNK